MFPAWVLFLTGAAVILGYGLTVIRPGIPRSGKGTSPHAPEDADMPQEPVFDHQVEYESKVEPLIIRLYKACEAAGIPLVVLACYARDGKGTYESSTTTFTKDGWLPEGFAAALHALCDRSERLADELIRQKITDEESPCPASRSTPPPSAPRTRSRGS